MEAYREAGIHALHDWQVDCLSMHGVLDGGACVYVCDDIISNRRGQAMLVWFMPYKSYTGESDGVVEGQV